MGPQVFDTFTFTDGQALSATNVAHVNPVGISGIAEGTWTVRVVAADNDEDRNDPPEIDNPVAVWRRGFGKLAGVG